MKWISIISLSLISMISLISYFTKFNGSWSPNASDWGAFGSYLSGTIGVFAACLAVVWLVISVTLQKQELKKLKIQLDDSSKEQKKQTHISAITALINSNTYLISKYEELLTDNRKIMKDIRTKDDPRTLVVQNKIKALNEDMSERKKENNKYTSQLKKILED